MHMCTSCWPTVCNDTGCNITKASHFFLVQPTIDSSLKKGAHVEELSWKCPSHVPVMSSEEGHVLISQGQN